MKRYVFAFICSAGLFASPGDTLRAQQICWLEEAFGAAGIHSADIDGSDQRMLALDPFSLPEGLTIDPSGNLFWTELSFSAARVHRAGPAFENPAAVVTGGSAFRGIALDQEMQKLYWITSNLQTGPVIVGTSLAGGVVETLAVLGARSNPRGLVVDTAADMLYWCEYDEGSIRAISRQQGGIQTDVATGLAGPYGLALDENAGWLYWTEMVGNRIRKMRRDGSELTTVLDGLSRPAYLALNGGGTDLLWAELEPGRIMLSAADGSNPKVVPVSVVIPGGVVFASTWTSAGERDDPAPSDFLLAQNYPNPFNPSTTIRFALPRAGQVKLEVFDPLGASIAVLLNGHLDAGQFTVEFPGPGRTIATGTYFYRLTAEGFVSTRSMVHLK